MERTVELVAALGLAVLGLSHLLHPRAWVDFFAKIRAAGEAGIFIHAILHLLPGWLLVASHNRWSGVGMIVTIIGWGWVIKGSVYMLAPGVGLRTLDRFGPGMAGGLQIGGAVLVVVAGVLAAAAIPLF
jgi:uncharacterized membrane protein